MIGGDVDGHGLLYGEYYVNGGMQLIATYTKVYVDDDETTVRDLTDVTLGKQTADGFAFTAKQGDAPLRCTALLYADATVSCSRDPSWIPPGAPGCADAVKSHVERFQCNGLRDIFKDSALDHDALLKRCSAAFRIESNRIGCARYAYNHVDVFDDYYGACTATYRTEDERNFCFFFTLAVADAKDRPTVEMIRGCKSADDKQTTACVFQRLTGAVQKNPKSKSTEPTDYPTPMVVPSKHSDRAPVTLRGGHFQDLSLQTTYGAVDGELFLFTDARAANGELRWSQMLERIVIGKSIHAFREVAAIDRVTSKNDVITFRAMHGGKVLTCTGNAWVTYARCK